MGRLTCIWFDISSPFNYFFRTICKLFLFKLSGYRTLLQSPVPERDFDPEKHEGQNQIWVGHRSGKEHIRISALSKNISSTTAAEYLSSKSSLQHSQKPEDLVPELTGYALYGELLFIFRPLLYGIRD